MKPHAPEFWYDLGVNPNDALKELARDKEGIIEKLQNSSLVSPAVRKAITRLTGYESMEGIARNKQSLFVEIWCLWKFYNNRRRVYLIMKYVDELDESSRRRFFKTASSRSDSFYCLIIASIERDELLKRFLLMDSVDFRSFQQLRLKRAAELSSITPMNSARIKGIASSLVEDFEEKRKEQKESTVERVLSENSATFLFVRRQIKEEIITQAKNSIVVRPAERIVVQFLQGGKEVHVSARTKKIAFDFVNLFAQKAWGKKIVYERISSINKERQIKSFLDAICAKPGKLPIVAVAISQSPLEGYPDLDLRHQETVVPSITQLRDMGIDILKRVEDIERLVVRFEASDVELRPSKNRDGTFELMYSDNRLPWSKREFFEREMSERWHLDVKPKG